MRKFTYKDVNNWKVVNTNGAVLKDIIKDKKGNTVVVEHYDGYRSARVAARKLGGYAVRQ